MAALSGITAVRATSDTKVGNPVLCGASVSAGQPVYKDAADSKHKLADANLSAAAADVKGIAVTPGVDAGYLFIAVSGSIILVGTTMVVGATYYLSPTAGSIIPEADLATGDRVVRLGTASTTTQLDLDIKNLGITKP